MKIITLLTQIRSQLKPACDHPALEADVLMAFVLQQPRSYLFAHSEQELTKEQQATLANLAARRLAGEPLAYIVGKKEFWSMDLSVTKDVLIPRPETELLVETVLSLLGQASKERRVADLGTGSGAIAIAIAHERPSWQVFACDVSENALQLAVKNAQQLELNNISFSRGSWCTALPCGDFDAIVSNPPYLAETEWPAYAEGLAYEPQQALLSGKDGLDDIRIISKTAKSYLKSGAYLLLEHGFQQAAAVREILVFDGYIKVHSIHDLAGQERITVGSLS